MTHTMERGGQNFPAMPCHTDSSGSQSRTKPHALVFPGPAQGLIIPMLHFSMKLAVNGFYVTFATIEYNHVRLKRSLAKAEALGIRFLGIPHGLPEEINGTANNILELCRAVNNMGNVFEKLVVRLEQEGRPVTCIISDFFNLFTQDVANKHGIPRAAFWTQSIASYSVNLAVSKGYRPPTEISNGVVRHDSEHLITCIPGAPPVRLTDLHTFIQCLDPSDYIFNFLITPFQRVREATWVLVNTFEELESSGLDAIKKDHDIHAVGPLLPASFFTDSREVDAGAAVGIWPADYDCLHWLDAQAPSSVLYVSFGSVCVLTQRDIEEFALGLEASEQSFVWVVRENLMRGGVPAVFPEGFKERIGSRGIFTSWAPQLQVLRHPSVGGFLTHGGWNSTLESISAGVPMVVWPYFADQRLNGRCIVDVWKVGLSLEAEEDGLISRKEVEVKVRALMMGSEEMRDGKVKQLKGGAKGAVEEGGSSAGDFHRFVSSVCDLIC